MNHGYWKLIFESCNFGLYSNYVPKMKKSDKIIPVSGPVTSGRVQVMFNDILSSYGCKQVAFISCL